MKYAFFAIAVMGIVPLTAILVLWRKTMSLAILGLVLPIVYFQETAINFFSEEWYRGTSRGMEISIIYLIAISILIAGTILWGPLNPLPDGGSRIYFLYFIISLLSFKNAANTLFSCFELWKMLMMYLVFISTYYYLHKVNDYKAVFIRGFGLLICITFLGFVSNHLGRISQARAFFPHQNSAAMYMSPLGTLALALFLTSEKPKQSVWYMFLFLMASACVFRTYSRGAIACYPIACVLTGSFCMLFKFRYQKAVKLIPLMILGLFGVLLATPKIIQRFVNAPEASKNTRIGFAISARKMVAENPVLGVGLNNWGIKINYPQYMREEKHPGDEGKADGIVETIYLLVAAECGISGLLMLLIWFMYYWIKSIFLLFKLKGTELFFIPAGLSGGLLSIYMQSGLEWVLKQQINFMEIMIFFAALSALGTTLKHSKNKRMAANVWSALVNDSPSSFSAKNL